MALFLSLKWSFHGGGDKNEYDDHIIDVSQKVHRPKINSKLKEELVYQDVDEGLFLHEFYGKTVVQLQNWDSSPTEDFIAYDDGKYKKNLLSLLI